MNRKADTEQLFKMPGSPFEKISDGIYQAELFSENLYDAALKEIYCQLTEKELCEFLDCAFHLLDDNGLIKLVFSEDMPSDARVNLWYHPTYAAALVALYAWRSFPNIWVEERVEKLKTILRGCTKRRLSGHGIEAAGERQKNLTAFIKAGALDFVKNNSDFCPEFTDLFHSDLALEGKQIESALKGYPHTVFVYGTLMKHQTAHNLLAGAIFGGTCILENHALYDLGDFPGLKEKNGHKVRGEIYFITEKMLSELDRYEGEGTLYHRQKAVGCFEKENLVVEAYYYLGQTFGNPISEWRRQSEDEIWYATYGSNLSAERFSCYIHGGVAPNGKMHVGCRKDSSHWKEDEFRKFPGRLYFGNNSGSWNGGGVAFYDPQGTDEVQMRLYRISWAQMKEIQEQEGNSPEWYGNCLLLGIGKDGLPVYTLTSEKRRSQNIPDEKYVKLIRTALIEEGHLSEKTVDGYLERALEPIAVK